MGVLPSTEGSSAVGGVSAGSYFRFLRWVILMNLNLALVWAGFVTIPLLLDPMEGNPFEGFTVGGFISGEGTDQRALSGLALSCLVLSGLVLSCPVLSCLVLSWGASRAQ